MDIWTSPRLIVIMRILHKVRFHYGQYVHPAGPLGILQSTHSCDWVNKLRHDSPGHYFWTPGRLFNMIPCCFWKSPKKGSAWVKVWFLEYFNFCISQFLFFSVYCQPYYWISLGHEEVEGQDFKHILELLNFCCAAAQDLLRLRE